jgi:uncharacterized iron-regulated protein
MTCRAAAYEDASVRGPAEASACRNRRRLTDMLPGGQSITSTILGSMFSVAFVLLLALSGQAMGTPGPPAQPSTQIGAAADSMASATYVPERVFRSDKKRFTDFEAMLADLQSADVVLVGEQHDDPNTHRLELAMMDGLARRRGSIILSLEMFERDVQATLDAYLRGTFTEEEFLEQSRPWPRYKTDYRGLVELAKARGWTVVASNVPRTLANGVSKTGLDFLKTLTGEQNAWVASDLRCPFDNYFRNFAEVMNAHPMPGDEKKSPAEKKQTTERFYFAQCLKDETMAESIASAHQKVASSRPVVVHFTGSFHSDYGLGTASRVERRLKGARVRLVTMVPAENLDRLNPTKDDRKRADYLVYTYRPKPTPAGAR